MDLVLLNISLSIYTHVLTYKRKQMKILSFLNLYVIIYIAIDWKSNFMWNSYWRIKIFGCCKLQYVLNFLFTVLADFLLVFDHCDGKWIIWRWKYMREGEREREGDRRETSCWWKRPIWPNFTLSIQNVQDLLSHFIIVLPVVKHCWLRSREEDKEDKLL